MKRSVIQLAGKTSVVSLPSKWVKQFGIQKGDELDIEQVSNTLVIKPNRQGSEIKKIELDINNYNERVLRCSISALHKLGYDEITLKYEKPILSDTIQDLTRTLLLGFIVSDQTPKKIVLKNISIELEKEFDASLRRAFLVVISFANSSLDLIKTKQYSTLPTLINLENTNNQLTSFCLRLINKGLYKNKEKEVFIITLIWELEKICDEYKHICQSLEKNKDEIQEETINLYSEVNNFFTEYYNLVYTFSTEKLNNLVDKKEELMKNLNNIKSKAENERKLVNLLITIVSKTGDMSSSIFAIYLEKQQTT